jgi:hypothetical protein
MSRSSSSNLSGDGLPDAPGSVSRRDSLAVFGGAWLASLAGSPLAAAVPMAGSPLPASLAKRFLDPAWNFKVDTRIEGDLDPKKIIHGFNRGILYAVRAGEALRPMFGYEVFSSIRLVPQKDGSIERLCREVIFYRNLETGVLMDEWTNPWTGERVKVVDVANDPINFILSPEGPRSSRHPAAGKKSPLGAPAGRRHEWYLLNANTVALEKDTHLFYPSFLRPEKWARESPGPMTRVSEFMRYSIRLEDLENDALTHIPHTGTWTRVTPWLPWMLMEQAPGHCLYLGMFSTRRDPAGFPADVVDRLKARYPKYLTAPEAWSEPSYSSLEHYSMEQTPAPKRMP